MLFCFSLIEAYFNGIAWDFFQDHDAFDKLSKRDQARITDIGHTNLREKIIKYTRIVTGRPLWNETDEPINQFLTIFNPIRDSLVHPSPFSAPEKFGGYDKLHMFYNVDPLIALKASKNTCDLIMRVHKHLNGNNSKTPEWLSGLIQELDKYEIVETS